MKSLRIIALSMCAILSAGGAAVAPAQDGAALDGAALYASKTCLACHGPDARTPILPIYPKVAGQHADYTFNQLRDIKAGTRSNGQASAMKGVMLMVNEEEMRAIAEWLATQ